ncbi:signal protein [Kitasatospora sp. NPDC088351]|uniref:signal protein n=1 Tax=Kitasatospora sp. NPDC088351 TaxID=3155180 RepID=UPI0034153408
MRLMRFPVLVTAVLFLAAACSGSPDPVSPSHARPSSLPAPDAETQSEPARIALRDLTSAEFQHMWWNWAASTEASQNPVMDTDGRFCSRGQRDEGIWFLAGTFGGAATRTCTVPEGASVAFPLVSRVSGESSDCLSFMNEAKGSAVLDSRTLPHEELASTRIRLTPVEGSPISEPPGIFTWSCGLWVRLDPLTPGTHELSIRGSSGTFSVSVDYKLLVSKPKPTEAV